MKVLQLIDSLHAGGAERMAVLTANLIAEKGMESFLVATREEGILLEQLHPKVGYLFLRKKFKFDPIALLELKDFVVRNDISIIHAHSTSFFLAYLLKLRVPSRKLIWHDHYGRSEELDDRSAKILKVASRRFNHVISVNEKLEKWALNKLKTQNVSYLNNFSMLNFDKGLAKPISGEEGKRILCLANFRHQKDHENLFRAWSSIQNRFPDWSLHCVGKSFEDGHYKKLQALIDELKLKNLFIYGDRTDIGPIIKNCQIGVLSSRSEGLPLALIEYGLGELAVVCTDSGQCREVLDDNGFLVEVENHELLAEKLSELISSENLRSRLSKSFSQHIVANYGPDNYFNKLNEIYNSVL